VGRIDTETERRLRAVEKTAEDAKGTTITQTVTTTTPSTGGSTPSSPTQYSAGVVAPLYPLTIQEFSSSTGSQTFVIDDANDLGFGAGALVVAKNTSPYGVRIYSPGNLNNYTDIGGLTLNPDRITLLPGVIIAGSRWWWIGLSSQWGLFPGGSNSVSRIGNQVWWTERTGGSSSTAYVTRFVGPDLVPQTATTLTGMGTTTESVVSYFVAGAAGQFLSYTRDLAGGAIQVFHFRPNDTTSPWVTISVSERWNSSACVDAEGLWYIDGTLGELSLVTPGGAQSFFADVLPFTVSSGTRLVPLGNRNFFWSGHYESGSTEYPTIWNVSPLGSTLLLEGDGSPDRRATAVGRASNGDVYARFNGTPNLYRVVPS